MNREEQSDPNSARLGRRTEPQKAGQLRADRTGGDLHEIRDRDRDEARSVPGDRAVEEPRGGPGGRSLNARLIADPEQGSGTTPRRPTERILGQDRSDQVQIVGL